MAATTYDEDVIAWAHEQAELIRKRQFDQLDIDHLAEEIEDVGKSEQREFALRMVILLVSLLKWQYQPARRCDSGKFSIKEQRCGVKSRLKRVLSLQAMLSNADWQEDMWGDAIDQATQETGINFPPACPWTFEQILDEVWLPE